MGSWGVWGRQGRRPEGAGGGAEDTGAGGDPMVTLREAGAVGEFRGEKGFCLDSWMRGCQPQGRLWGWRVRS